MPRPINPITIELIDSTGHGQVARFLLSMGGIRRIKTKFGVKTMQELLGGKYDVDEVAVPILFEAMLEKPAELTEDKFADMLDADMAGVSRAIGELVGASFPEPNPPVPTPIVQ